jgi:ketosteroid isomerase-like protein
MHTDPMEVINRLLKAGNEHDLSSFVACMSEDYKSEQPVHPDRAFQGRDQVRKNWSAIFEQIPDLRMELLNAAVQGNQVWTEWQWSGTRRDDSPFNLRGVTIFTVQGDEITAGRLYMEAVQGDGAGIDATVKQMTST